VSRWYAPYIRSVAGGLNEDVLTREPRYFQSSDGRYVASGHKNGSVYVFSNESGRLVHNLPGTCGFFNGPVRRRLGKSRPVGLR
jgi:hypothetical protein